MKNARKILPLIIPVFILVTLFVSFYEGLFVCANAQGYTLTDIKANDINAPEENENASDSDEKGAITENSGQFTGKNLQYFELKSPVSVYREDEKVYIAQPELLIIYENDTYKTIELSEFDVKHIEKCGNLMLILSNNNLYAVDLTVNELLPAPLFEKVNAFSVNNDTVILNIENKVIFAKLDESGTSFTEYTPKCETELVGNASALYLYNTQESETYYYSNGNMIRLISNRTTTIVSDRHSNVRQIKRVGDEVYFSTEAAVYKINANTYDTEIVFLSETLNITKLKDFFISDNLMLLCDEEGDRVIEYDLNAKALTGFEISFTKIPLPENFSFSLNVEPCYVVVTQGTELYDINLKKSLSSNYFVFNGYFLQKTESRYLVIKQTDDYYLISGEKIALVLKTDYDLLSYDMQDEGNKTMLISNDLRAFLLPDLNDSLIAFNLNAKDEVTVLKTINVGGVLFALVKNGENVGFIPESYLVESFYSPTENKNFTTATTSYKPTTVFADDKLTEKQDVLGKYSTVLVYSEKDGVCYVSYGNGKFGYIPKTALTKKGYLTDRIVAAVTLFLIAATVTAIYLENKYLYTK